MPIAGAFGSNSDQPLLEAELILALKRMVPSSDDPPRFAADVHMSTNCALAVTAPAELISQSRVTVACEGRLFEPDVLASRLGEAPKRRLSRLGPLILAAYRRWGAEFALQLDGEFSFCIYDETERRLLAGRDVVGRGSIHFYPLGQSVLLATESRALFAFSGVKSRPNRRAIAALGTLQSLPGETCYQGVRYPPAGHIIALRSGQTPQVIRQWFPERAPQLHLKDTREYAEALLAAMRRAVELRLPPTGLVATELSAGYDSSAVTALAAAALLKQNRQLVAYTAVPAHANVGADIVEHGIADEWPLANRVAVMFPNIEHVPVQTSSAPWPESIDCMTEVFGVPPLFVRNLPWMYSARRMAQERGVSTLLNGQNGNLAGSYDGAFALFDMRRRGNWALLAHTSREWHRAGAGWRSILMRAWMPSNTTRTSIRRRLGRPRKSFAAHSLMRPDFVRSEGISLPEDSPLGNPVDGDRTNGASRRLSIMQMVDFGVQYAVERRLFGLDRSDPTADRHLVELCLSIPDHFFCPGGMRRQLYREAMRSVLPKGLLADHGFGIQASDFLENFGEGMPAWLCMLEEFEQSPSVANCLDLPRLRTLLADFQGRVAHNRAEADMLYNYTVGGAFTLARFLQKLECLNA